MSPDADDRTFDKVLSDFRKRYGIRDQGRQRDPVTPTELKRVCRDLRSGVIRLEGALDTTPIGQASLRERDLYTSNILALWHHFRDIATDRGGSIAPDKGPYSRNDALVAIDKVSSWCDGQIRELAGEEDYTLPVTAKPRIIETIRELIGFIEDRIREGPDVKNPGLPGFNQESASGAPYTRLMVAINHARYEVLRSLLPSMRRPEGIYISLGDADPCPDITLSKFDDSIKVELKELARFCLLELPGQGMESPEKAVAYLEGVVARIEGSGKRTQDLGSEEAGDGLTQGGALSQQSDPPSFKWPDMPPPVDLYANCYGIVGAAFDLSERPLLPRGPSPRQELDPGELDEWIRELRELGLKVMSLTPHVLKVEMEARIQKLVYAARNLAVWVWREIPAQVGDPLSLERSDRATLSGMMIKLRDAMQSFRRLNPFPLPPMLNPEGEPNDHQNAATPPRDVADADSEQPPKVDPFAELRLFAATLGTKERRVVDLICDRGGKIPKQDLAIDPAICWDDPYDDALNSTLKRVNRKLKRERKPWAIFREKNHACVKTWRDESRTLKS